MAHGNRLHAPDEASIRALTSTDAGEFLVVTLLLDVDGRRMPRKGDYELHLQGMLRDARAALDRRGSSREAARAARADLDRVQRYVQTEFERGDARGLAVFASEPIGLWEAFRLPRSAGNRLVLDRHPHVLRLEQIVFAAEPIVTAIVGRDRARVFVTRMGETIERSEILDEVPGRHEQGGWSQARYQRHIDEHAQQHWKRTEEALLRLDRVAPHAGLILAGPEGSVADFEKSLRSQLAERIVARVSLPMSASLGQVKEATRAVQERLEEERASEVAERVREESAARRAGVTGLAATLSALVEGRAMALVLAGDGAAPPGWRCGNCGYLELSDGACPACGRPMDRVQDLIEEMVDEAIRRGCQVVPARPEALPEGVGALLRF